MKNLLIRLINRTCCIIFIALTPIASFAQCDTWMDHDNIEELQDYYAIYRDYLSRSDYEKAFPYWKKLYESSPALDGKKHTIFNDGRTIYIKQFDETDESKDRKEIAQLIVRLEEDQKKCFPHSVIPPLPARVAKYR